MRFSVLTAVAALITYSTTLEGSAPNRRITFSEHAVYDRHESWMGEEAGMWCANPKNPRELIGITNTFVAREGIPKNPRWILFHNVVKHSADGGRSWAQVFITDGVPGLSDVAVGGAPGESDPACAYGEKNVAFIGAMADYYDQLHEPKGFTPRSHVFTLWRSEDGGRSWGNAVPLRFPGFFDRPHISVDRLASPFRGRLYVAGATMALRPDTDERYPGRIVVFRSDDQGRSFKESVMIPTGVGTGDGVIHMGMAAVVPGGAYAVSWAEGEIFGLRGMFDKKRGEHDHLPGPIVVKFAISHDGGASFEAPVIVARAQGNTISGGKIAMFGKWPPALAVDTTGGRAKGNLYMAWHNAREGGQDIQFSRSTDQGTTWSAAKTISGTANPNARSKGPYAGTVTLAVNGRGVIGALYYSQRKPGPTAEVWPVFTYSTDSGATWSTPKRVGKHPIIRSVVPDRYKRTDFGSGMPPAEELGPEPTCNYGLTVDTAGIFHVFVVTNVDGRTVITTATAD